MTEYRTHLSDIELLERLEDRFDARLVVPDELARTAHARLTELLSESYDEKATTASTASAPELPTEPGWYEATERPLRGGFAPYELRDGEWECNGRRVPSSYDLTAIAPFTRLGSVVATAEAFMVELMNCPKVGNTYQVHASTLLEVAAKFGVTS